MNRNAVPNALQAVPNRLQALKQASAAPTPDSGLYAALLHLDLSLSEMAVLLGIGRTSAHRLVTLGEWPKRDAGVARQKFEAYLAQKKLAPVISNTTEAVPEEDPLTETPMEEPMLLQNHELYVETQDHFKLERNPFMDDINCRADVFTSPGTRRVRAAMLNAATNHGFIAVIGESGSGKTTLRKELEERIRIERLPIRIIKPYIVQMEPTDTKGKTMKSAAIADAIARTLSPGLTLKSSPDARFAQVHALLTASSAAGYSNLIVIEEAHRLPQATLRHLKGFMEMEDGMRRVLGVCLIGQPELDDLLGSQNRDIREIVQRCNRITLAPLEEDLEAYLQHKFERAGVKASTVLAANAFKAIAAKLIHIPRGGTRLDARSLCYPLVVNNLVCKAMNFAAQEHWPQVDAQVIAGC